MSPVKKFTMTSIISRKVIGVKNFPENTLILFKGRLFFLIFG